MTILALVLLGFALRGFAEGDSEEAVAGSTSQSTSTPEDEGETSAAIPDMGEDLEASPSQTPEASTQASPEPTPEPEVADATDSSEPVALQECYSEVAAGDDWADATADSAAHWKRHYGASVAYHDGRITLKKAEQEFAASKAKGAADTKAVASTKKAYEKAAGACDSLSASDLPDSSAGAAEACSARANAISEVVPVGTEVNGDWFAHLDMMKTKDETDPAEYHKRWQMMVSMAPDDMGPYEKAVRALDKAPACPSA